MTKNKLSGQPLSIKAAATGFIITLMLGYSISFVQIYKRTSFNMEKVTLYYRGAESGPNAEILLPQSFASLLSVAHVHTLSQPMMFGLMGLIFALTPLSERKKAFFITLGFFGSVVSNASPWLVRYGSGSYVYLFPLSQACIFGSLVVMSLVSIYCLWFLRGQKTDHP